MYDGTKMGSHTQIDYKNKVDNKYDLLYFLRYHECHEDSIVEIDKRPHEQICDHLDIPACKELPNTKINY